MYQRKRTRELSVTEQTPQTHLVIEGNTRDCDTQDDHHLHTVAGDLDQFLDVIQKHPKDVRLKKVK